MKTFEVHKEELRGTTYSAECYADGEFVEDANDLENVCLTTGFSVYLYDEQGVREDTIFYPVHTNTENWENDEDKVIEQIKRDFPPTEYQNNNW